MTEIPPIFNVGHFSSCKLGNMWCLYVYVVLNSKLSYRFFLLELQGEQPLHFSSVPD